MTESSARRAVIACAIIAVAVVNVVAVMAIASMRARERAEERYGEGGP